MGLAFCCAIIHEYCNFSVVGAIVIPYQLHHFILLFSLLFFCLFVCLFVCLFFCPSLQYYIGLFVPILRDPMQILSMYHCNILLPKMLLKGTPVHVIALPCKKIMYKRSCNCKSFKMYINFLHHSMQHYSY